MSHEIQPSIDKQLSTIFNMLDKIIKYETDVCGDDKSSLEEYKKISDMIWNEMGKIR